MALRGGRIESVDTINYGAQGLQEVLTFEFHQSVFKKVT